MDELDELVAVIPPLLSAMEALDFIARYTHPPDLKTTIAHFADHDVPLQDALPRMDAWTDGLAHLKPNIASASVSVLEAFALLRSAVETPNGDMRAVFRALRRLPQAQEALYPLAAMLPVSRYYLDPEQRGDDALLQRLATPSSAQTGVMHAGAEPGERGGFSLYVPEDYTPERAWPLVMALHGGGGNGRNFLWSWLRDARGRDAILCAPTAIGSTWAIADDDDPDTPNLARALEFIRSRWNIDEKRMLLTGMSDGGTFTYASGLEAGSPFTHLAPVAASFHPVLAQLADPDRLKGLPIFVIHGALDWMFDISVAREAQASLTSAGASVMYWELDDLSHTYPREVNSVLLEWLSGTLEAPRSSPRPA